MPRLSKFSVQDLRNLGSVDIKPGPILNVIIGPNGAGKTSFLEGLGILAHGRSFRTHKYRSVIKQGSPCFTVFAKVIPDSDTDLTEIPFGIQKFKNGSFQIKVDQKKIPSSSELAKQLPLLVIDSSSFKLVDGSPKDRRQFFDWLVFHVKQDFSALWKQVSRCYKQRNSLLRRDKITYSDIEPWDLEIARISRSIDKLRSECFHLLAQEYRVLTEKLGGKYSFLDSIELSYKSGWKEELVPKDYSEQLKENFGRDVANGYSTLGPQKSDLLVKSGKMLASEVLSRGQLKLLIAALFISEARILKLNVGKQPIFAIDDLPSELDQENQVQLGIWLDQLGAQVFVTGTDHSFISNIIAKNDDTTKVFHVKHGIVTDNIN